jgi:hypothetical protein
MENLLSQPEKRTRIEKITGARRKKTKEIGSE